MTKKTYDIEDLKKMTPEKRAILYENAKRHLAAGGKEIIDLLDNSGLPLSSGGMTTSDPTYVRMVEIVWSTEGRKAAIAASDAGLPALAGVEPMLVAELGDRYHPHDQGTVRAGSIVGELMQHLGYVKDGEDNMPNGSVAKTAMKWKRRPR